MSKLYNNRIVARVAAKGNNRSVMVRVDHTALITFLGASCNASIQPGNDCNSVTFFPMPNKPALVALAVWNREKTPSDWVRAYFLDITWKDGGLPWIDLDEAWIPSGDQPAQASKWGVTVKIGGVTYGSCPNDINRQSAMLRFVRDGNLLYRFLAGEATAEEVVAAAEAFQEEEAWPTKYAALQRLLNEEKSAFAQSQVELRAKCRESAKAMSKEADARIAELHEALRKIARIAHSARFGNRAKTLQTILKIIWP